MKDDSNKENKAIKRLILTRTALPVLFCAVLIGLFAYGAVRFLKPPENGSGSDLLNQDSVGILPESGDNNTGMTVAPSAIGDITVVPVKSSPQGVEVDSEFLITTKTSMPKEYLRESLSITSGETFVVDEDKTSRDSFVLRFDEPLRNDTLYNIIYTAVDKQPLSFAFQTVSTFQIRSTTPGRESYGVPVNSGIEVTFSHQILGDFKDYFNITPHTGGRFEQVANTYMFIPDAGLAYDTEYTIVISEGIKSIGGDALSEDYKFSFRTQWNYQDETDCVVRGGLYETFLPDDDVLVELYTTDILRDKTFTVDIYDLQNADNYISYQESNTPDANIPGYALHEETLQTELFAIDNGDGYRNYYYIMLHKPLPEGYHLVNIKTEHNGTQYSVVKLIQVSGLSVYSASLNGETCFWIHDTATGKAAESAEIDLDGKKGKTNAEGIAIMKTTSNDSSVVKIDYPGYKTHVYKNRTYDPKNLTPNEKYYTYIYTDRKYYRPDDTIDVFGVVKEKRSEFKATNSDNLTLRFGNMQEIPISPDEYGSFNVKIPVDNMSGAAAFQIALNGQSLMTEPVYVFFMDYPRDKYILSAETDRKAYFVGETADIELAVTTFDGTPIEGVEIANNSYNYARFKTGDGGMAYGDIGIEKSRTYHNEWQPYIDNLWFSVVGVEEYSQSFFTDIMILPSDIMLEYTVLSENSIEFTSSAIDREAIEQYSQEHGGAYSVDPDVYRGSPADVDFTITVTKRAMTRKKSGEHYDFIRKVNVPEYSYDTEEEYYDIYTARTVNGRVVVMGLPVSYDPLVSYYGTVNFVDRGGRESSFNVYFGNERRLDVVQSTNREYYFKFLRSTDTPGSMWNYQLGLNETGQIRLTYSGADADEVITEGKILTLLTNEKIVSASSGSPVGTPVTFTEDCIYISSVFGAYFDGRYIFPVQYPLGISYDYNEKTLDFDVAFDKESYQPGDEVTATVKVTDRDGNARNTLVNISVVDEAALSAGGGYNAYMPGNFYNSISFYNNTYYIYASYSRYGYNSTGGGGAEKGGGGDDYFIRKDFTDNPAFRSVETDENGIAKVTFKLSDAVTSWRVSVHGITRDNYVGNDKTNAIATLPYYIDLVMANEFVEGDEVSVVVKSMGSQYQAKVQGDEIDYTLEVLNGGSTVWTETKRGASRISFNAGKLPEGDYTVRVMANTGKYRDAMEEKVSVVREGLRLPVSANLRLTRDTPVLTSLGVLASPVDITLTNGDISDIMDILYSCMNRQTERTDYAAGIAYGNYFLSREKESEGQPSYIDNLKKVLPRYGGIPELFYGSAEPFYTARFAGCFPELTDKPTLARYIRETTHIGDEEYADVDLEAEALRAAGYFALAAAGESVLLDIYEQISIMQNSSGVEDLTNDYYGQLRVLFYASALCAAGDDVRAHDLASAYPASQTLLNNAKDVGERDYQREYIDTLTLYINTTVDPVKAFEYLRGKIENSYVSDVCEKINFLKKVIPLSGTASEIQYSLNGETRTVRLENYDRITLQITKEQFENLGLKYVSGNTAVKVSYTGGSGELPTSMNKIKMQKKVSPGSAESLYNILFTVQMPTDAIKGYYTIRDRVPSNMRFTKSSAFISESTRRYYVNNIEKQLVDIYFYYPGDGKDVEVMYDAIKVSDDYAVITNAYVSGNFRTDEIWGESK